MKTFSNKKQKIIGLIVMSIVILTAILLIAIKFNKFKIINNYITVEAGEELDLKVKDLVKADKEVLSQITLDTSNVNTNKTGEYTVSLFYKDKEYKINIIVVDTKAPKATFKNRCVFTNDIESIVIEELFEQVKEYSKYEVMFTSCEKETELEEITDEKLKSLEENLKDPKKQKMLAKKISDSVPAEEGIYRTIIKLEDKHGNARYEEFFIILDKTAPIIEDISEMTIETSDLSQEPEVSSEDYKVTDNVDGSIASSDIICKLELTDSEKHVYVNHVSVTDRAGNSSTTDVTITLVQKKVVSTSNSTSAAGGNNGAGSVTVSAGPTLASEISGFPVVYQRPELPTGCEVTALTMLINYYGYPVSKTTMASTYLPQVASGYTGRVDLDYYFCGNPYGVGIGCGAGALVTAANSYFAASGSSLRGVDITGTSAEGLYDYISNGKPVVVMVTIGMANRKATSGWYTSEGKYVTWGDNDHGVVLIGCDSNNVKVACPLFGIKTYSRAQFEKVYAARGNRAMIIQ